MSQVEARAISKSLSLDKQPVGRRPEVADGQGVPPGRRQGVLDDLDAGLPAQEEPARVARLGARQVGFEQHAGAHRLVTGAADGAEEGGVRVEDAGPLAPAVNPPVKRV